MKPAVTSPSFSKHPVLIKEMETYFPQSKLNHQGKRFNKTELIEYLSGHDSAIVGLDIIDEEVLSALPELKIIAKYGVGLNNIDLEACKRHDVKIGWTGGVNKLSVAEMTLGNMLVLSRNIYQSSSLLSNGEWKKDGGVQLSGKTIGIIGMGHIGKEVVRLLRPFHCKIMANDIIEQPDFYNQHDIIPSSKKDIFSNCDVVTIHTPYTEQTHNLVNKESLSLMKQNAVLINSARGGIINEEDLKEVLLDNKISAALDVYKTEPPTDLEMLKLPNLLCTPHIGGNAKEAVELMGLSAISHLKKHFNV